jgi:hypothetical protein
MKDYVKIHIDKFGHYFPYEIKSEDLDFLANFLTSDVHDVPGWKKWALDQTQDFTTSNYASLQKENDLVLIGEEFAEDLDAGPFCKIPLDEFIKILDQWGQFCKTRPKEIWITRENGEIKMEGKY